MKYFSLQELSHTNTGLPNAIPDAEVSGNLTFLVDSVLDPAREALGVPIRISSGYRCPAVNKMVGGAASSQHVTGQAADLVTGDTAKLFHWLRVNTKFDQLIWEYGTDKAPQWVHVSASKTRNRGQVLRAIKTNGVTKYLPYA